MKILTFLILFFSVLANAKETRKRIIVLDTGISASQLSESYLCKNGVVSVIGNSPIIPKLRR